MVDQHSSRAAATHPLTPVLYEAAFSTTGERPQCGVALARTIEQARAGLADMLVLCDPAAPTVADITEFTRAHTVAVYSGTVGQVFAQLAAATPATDHYDGTAGDITTQLTTSPGQQMITITHTPATGTLLEGTTKGDGTNQLLRAGGLHWRWSAHLGAWYLPRTRDTAPQTAVITATAETLRTAGHTVTVTIHTGHRSTAEVEADRAERQQDRADALAAKASRQADAARAAHEHARQLTEHIPFGQPILVGHHSEGRMRRHAKRIHAAMDATVQAATEAEETQRRAQVAQIGTDARYNPVTIANRITRLTAEHARITRQLNGHTRTVAVSTDGTRHIETTTPASGQHHDRLTQRLAHITGQLTYWQAIRQEQITTGTATGHGPATIHKGDTVQIRGRWYTVVRANKKTVTVPSTLGAWTDTAPYHEIQDHRPAQN